MRPLIRESIQSIVLALTIFVVLGSTIQNFRVEGYSMRDTLHEGQYVIVNKAVYWHLNLKIIDSAFPFFNMNGNAEIFPFHPPSRVEVVKFKFPNDKKRDFVKRIIGEPGDIVEITNGIVTVNGKPLKEPYATAGYSVTLESVKVPENAYYVLGDNRPVSSDSRAWGLVPADNIVGRAWVTYWPLDQIGVVKSLGGS